MEGLIVGISPFIWAIVSGVLLLAGFYFLWHRALIVAGPIFIGAFIMAVCWYVSSTAFIIAPNNRGFVVNRTTGQVVGDQLNAGIHYKALFNEDVYTYPGATEQEWCASYTPSVVGGFEVNITLCFYYNAADTNWVTQFQTTNRTSGAAVQDYWQNQLKTVVASVVRQYSGTQLTSERSTVEAAVYSAAETWFSGRGVTLVSATIPNWNYTNPEVEATFDNNAFAQARREQAEQDRMTAVIERDVALYRAETQVQVFNALANGQTAALNALGIDESQARAWFLVQREMIAMIQSMSNATIVVSMGDQTLAIPPGAAQPTALPPQ